jgi:YebC/PmpR family DNA-binding regulatory protein
MSGHSHWAGIKHKKALVDAKRGKLWSKLAKAIIVAAKHGGGDPDANLRLRYAIDDAKAVSMPKENIQRAIKRGTGELDGAALEEVMYEGYGSGGVAVLCEILTDNRNRTAPEIRRIFELSDGKLGGVGCVAWMFESKGLFLIPASAVEEDKLMELALEAGAEDVHATDDGKFEVICDPTLFHAVEEALSHAEIEPEASQLTRIAKNMVDIQSPETAQKILKLMERLDDHDDVQNVSSNFNIPEAVMRQIGEG